MSWRGTRRLKHFTSLSVLRLKWQQSGTVRTIPVVFMAVAWAARRPECLTSQKGESKKKVASEWWPQFWALFDLCLLFRSALVVLRHKRTMTAHILKRKSQCLWKIENDFYLLFSFSTSIFCFSMTWKIYLYQTQRRSMHILNSKYRPILI